MSFRHMGSSRRRKNEVEWPALPRDNLLSEKFGRCNSQSNDALPARLCRANRACTSRALYANDPVRDVDSRAPDREHLALAQPRKSRERD